MDMQGAEIERGEVVYKLCSGVDYSLDLDVDVVAVAVSVTCVRCRARDAVGIYRLSNRGRYTVCLEAAT
jgi:hypothetical protein